MRVESATSAPEGKHAPVESAGCVHDFAYDVHEPWRICLRCGRSETYRIGIDWGAVRGATCSCPRTAG